CHPAKVFMGDTGSLAIGGLIGVVAICCKQELLLVVVGGVFVIEAVSVILQGLSFKLTGKRIFAMSPPHHHSQPAAWKANPVTVLDSADENKLLKSTIDNLRAQNIRVICGPAADQDSGKYDFVVASPGIDPASALAQNFSSRKIEIIGELELGWRSCETPVIA